MSRKIIQVLLRQPRGASPKRNKSSGHSSIGSDGPSGSGSNGRRGRGKSTFPGSKWERTLFPDSPTCSTDDDDSKPCILRGVVGTTMSSVMEHTLETRW